MGRGIAALGSQVERLLMTYQKEIVDRQYQLGRIADAATELYVSSCVLNRLDAMLRHAHDGREEATAWALQIGRYYLKTASRRVHRALAELWDNEDDETTKLANMMLRRG